MKRVLAFFKSHRDLFVVLSLGALVLACYWRIALAGRVLAGGDIFTYFYPYWAEATRAVQAGRLPLWNPHLFMGVPFLANTQVGFFYPLNWPLWLLLPAHRSIHLSIVLHLCVAALNAYLWGRTSLRLGRVGAWTVGVVFALGGYLGAQVEHVNQLQGLAWLPLLLTLCDVAGRGFPRRKGLLASVGLALVLAMVLLAGHTQTAFISLVGLAIYGLGPVLWKGLRRRRWRALWRRAAVLSLAVGLGIALAATQLIPTWELSRFSVRAKGLPFNERVSFSLSPLYLARAILPRFAASVPPDHVEHVAYVGVIGLLLAAFALRDLRHAGRTAGHALCQHVIFLLALGLFFALGVYNPLYVLLARYVPGFAHFRVPARWLVLYVIGVAGLAGRGAQALWRRRGRVDRRALLLFALGAILLMIWAVVGVRLEGGERVAWPVVAAWAVTIALALALLLLGSRAPRTATLALLGLLIVELLAASGTLPQTRATAPQAFTSLRPAMAHLLAADEGDGSPSRFLSMSDITFDPGDLSEIELIYGTQLSDEALYEYVIAAKQKEVLSPNLPLAFGIQAVDGYGGGVLPLARYVELQRLFLPEEEVSLDGRLRENLAAVPDGRWLSLFNVRHVITDKLRDAWIGDVFYDLQFDARLAPGEEAAVAHVPQFEATALGIVSHLEEGVALPQGTPVGVVDVRFADGSVRSFGLEAGQHTAEDAYGPDVAHERATVGREHPEGDDYVARLRWSEPAVPVDVGVRATLPEGELVVRGASLIDERTDSFQSLVLSDRGRFRLVHSGDVKVYENLDVLPRAFVVHRACSAADDEEVLAAMRDPAFDPAESVVLSANSTSCGDSGAETVGGHHRGRSEKAEATVVSYEPERVVIETTSDRSGHLVVTDAWYPGWRATVDGETVPIRRADLLFRAVAVEAGHHRVVFSFRPASVRIGAVVSLVGVIGVIAAVVYALCQRSFHCPKSNAVL